MMVLLLLMLLVDVLLMMLLVLAMMLPVTEVSGTVVIVVIVTASNVGVYSGAGVMVVMMRTASLRARRFRSAADDVDDVVEEGGEISATPSPR